MVAQATLSCRRTQIEKRGAVRNALEEDRKRSPFMKFGRIQLAVLIAAVFFAPQALVARAQTAPMAPPASNTQPNQPQQQAGGGGTQDSVGGPDASTGLVRDKMF